MITNIIAFALDVKNYFRYCLSQLITNQTTRRNRVMEIPKFLIEMSEQMNNEDNRCTADPIWMVVHDNWLTCADDRGDKNILLLCNGGDHYIECDEDDYTEIFTYLKEDHEEWCMELIREHDEEEDDIFPPFFFFVCIFAARSSSLLLLLQLPMSKFGFSSTILANLDVGWSAVLLKVCSSKR